MHDGRAETRERVRDASDIVHVIGELVTLRPHGREHLGICPFHDDHKPSMTVVGHKQLFHCFSCGAGGDVFRFIEKYHRMTFPEALEYLARRAGIEIMPGPNERGRDHSVSRRDIIHANETGRSFFQTVLRHDEHGRRACELVARRGISTEMVEEFSLGASPQRWDGLAQTIEEKRLGADAFAQAGLLKRREQGGLYDAFRDRLMFPITDQAGRTIAFGGRRIDDADEPKYLNSAQSPVFDKSRALYGLAQASRSIQRQRLVIVCEGYTDVIACHQAGMTNVVGTLGTAFTTAHAELLARFDATVVLLFDGDDAGERAAQRAVDVVFARPIDVRIALLSSVGSAKDPDELLKSEDGADRLRVAIDAAPDVLEYMFTRLRARLAGAGPAVIERELRAELARLVDLGLGRVPPMRRQLMIRRLHEITSLDASVIAAAIPAGRRTRRAEQNADMGSGSERKLTVQEHLLGCALVDGDMWQLIAEEDRALFAPEHVPDPAVAGIARLMEEIAGAGRTPDVQSVIRMTDDGALKEAAIALSRQVESETECDPQRLHDHFAECLAVLRRQAARTRGAEGSARANDAAARIASLRETMAQGGGDRRVLPRQAEGAVSR